MEPATIEMELKATRFDVDGHVATVWLHRPHRHNAWTGRMHAEYRWIMAQLEADRSVRAVVVTGTPPAFCVGGDSDALAAHAERGSYDTGLPPDRADPGYGVQPEFDDDFAWHYGYRTPVIAAVNGAAAGIGLALALFCDLRFASAPAKITTAAPKLGLPAEYGMSWVLPRLVGVTRAADLLMSGRIVTAAETAEWGLWNEVLADGESALAARARLRPAARHHGRAGCRHDDQASALPRPPPPRRGGIGRASRNDCSTTRCARPSTAKGSPRSATDDRRASTSRIAPCGGRQRRGVRRHEPHQSGGRITRAPARSGELAVAGIASGAAGLIHLAAWGAHADATTLAVLFVVLAIAQLEVAVAGLVRPNKLTASALALVNLVAAAGWITTRFVGISWIDGLQQAEDPGLADTVAAVLAGVAVVGRDIVLRDP